MELRRAQQSQPTEPGWYYCSLPVAVIAGDPHPMRVEDNGAFGLMCLNGDRFRPMDDYAWFGPVPKCIVNPPAKP